MTSSQPHSETAGGDSSRPGKPVSEILPKTLETLEYARAPKDNAPLKKSSDEERRRKWLDKWLCIRSSHHPQLTALEVAVWEFCRDYAKQPGRGYRLVFFGNNGAGKSHSCRAIYRWASRVAVDLPWVAGDEGPRLPEARMVNWPGFVDSLKAGAWERMVPLMECELLILDDIGAEHDPSKMAAEKLYLFLERREYRWTVITTNFSPQNWERQFERRISSRLLRNFRAVALDKVPDFGSL